MPLYEYKCTECRSVFEVIQKINEPPLKKCLKCGAPVNKVISPPAIQFKGNGWYITDYAQKDRRDKKAPSPEKTDSPSEKKEDKKGPPPSSTK
ncbi:MAG: zinc ribbon domain-containing protein [Candidatus Aminicenantes bacterium]